MLQPLYRVTDGFDRGDRRPHGSRRCDKSPIRSDESEIDQPRSWIGETSRARLRPALLFGPLSCAIDYKLDLLRGRTIDRGAHLQLEKPIGDQLCHASPPQDDAIGQPAKTGANPVVCDRMVQKVRIE
jgi:hypothetical protein